MPGLRWDAEKTSHMLDMWNGGVPVEEIAERLGCSKNAITQKAYRMDIERPRCKGAWWSHYETGVLRRLWGSVPASEIAKNLPGRSTQAVTVRKAKKMGLPDMRGRRWREAKGVISRTGARQINMYFDPETFDEIVVVADKEKLSFSQAAMQLIEWGLMDRREAA
jgi:hypothetical protein